MFTSTIVRGMEGQEAKLTYYTHVLVVHESSRVSHLVLKREMSNVAGTEALFVIVNVQFALCPQINSVSSELSCIYLHPLSVGRVLLVGRQHTCFTFRTSTFVWQCILLKSVR